MGRVRFLGYSKGGKGYRLLEEVGNCVKHRCDITFDGTRFALPAPSEEAVDHVSDPCDRPEATEPVGARPKALPEIPTEVVERPQRHCSAIKRRGIDEVYLSEINLCILRSVL